MVVSEHVNLPGMTLHPLYTFMVELDIDKACGKHTCISILWTCIVTNISSKLSPQFVRHRMIRYYITKCFWLLCMCKLYYGHFISSISERN